MTYPMWDGSIKSFLRSLIGVSSMNNQCPRCLQTFARRTHLEEHISKKRPCAMVIKSEQNQLIDVLKKTVEELQSRIILLERVVFDIQRPEPVNIQIGNDNNAINININNYCQDDNAFLTLEDIKEVTRKDVGDILLDYARKVRSDPTHAESFKLRIMDEGTGAEVYCDGSWKRMDKSQEIVGGERFPYSVKESVELGSVPEENDNAAVRKAIERLMHRFPSKEVVTEHV